MVVLNYGSLEKKNQSIGNNQDYFIIWECWSFAKNLAFQDWASFEFHKQTDINKQIPDHSSNIWVLGSLRNCHFSIKCAAYGTESLFSLVSF